MITAFFAMSLVYDHAWGACRTNRLEILRSALPFHQGPDLPKNSDTIEWHFQGVAFKLLPFHAPPEAGLHGRKGQGRARFLMACPECHRWYSVGKYMLHAKIHFPKEN